MSAHSVLFLFVACVQKSAAGLCRSFYGCCDIGEGNSWFPQYRASNASALWLRDDNGKVAR